MIPGPGDAGIVMLSLLASRGRNLAPYTCVRAGLGRAWTRRAHALNECKPNSPTFPVGLAILQVCTGFQTEFQHLGFSQARSDRNVLSQCQTAYWKLRRTCYSQFLTAYSPTAPACHCSHHSGHKQRTQDAARTDVGAAAPPFDRRLGVGPSPSPWSLSVALPPLSE